MAEVAAVVLPPVIETLPGGLHVETRDFLSKTSFIPLEER